MLRVRHRWLLPLGHAAVDAIWLAAWIWHATVSIEREKGSLDLPKHTINAAAYQENSGIRWDPMSLPPSDDFMLMLTGCWPAGAISITLRPDAERQTGRHLWDPVWFVIHEGASILLWFAWGWWLDTGRSRLIKPMRLFLLTRLFFVLLYVTLWTARFGVTLQAMFWLGMSGYGIVVASQFLGRTLARAFRS